MEVRLIRFILGLNVVIFTLGVPTYLCFNGKIDAAIAICSFSIVSVLLVNAEKIASFEAWGVKAELRETVKNANATLEQLKDISISVATSTLTNLSSVQTPLREKIKQRDRIIASLEKIKISKDELERIQDGFNKDISAKYSSEIVRKIFNPTSQAAVESLNGHDRKLLDREFFNMGQTPCAAQIRDKIVNKGLQVDSEVNAAIDAYLHFEKTKEINGLDELEV